MKRLFCPSKCRVLYFKENASYFHYLKHFNLFLITNKSNVFLKDLGDLPPPAALSLQTIRAKVEKRTSIDSAPCTGSAATAACKPIENSGSSSSISPKSSPLGESHRDSRRDSRDSTVQTFCVFISVWKKLCVAVPPPLPVFTT